MGTPSYMSPEQVKGRAVDGRSDIFSLGVMLYEMVTGEKPFPGQNITTVIYKIVNEAPVPPRQINPSIHPGISAVIMRALEKEPDQRYQNCREMLEDLRITGQSPQAAETRNRRWSWAEVRPRRPWFPETRPAVVSPARSNRHGDGALPERAGIGSRPNSLVRRTGAIAPVPEPPKKKNVLGTILAASLLLSVIVYGANKIKPVFEARANFHDGAKEGQQLARRGAGGVRNHSGQLGGKSRRGPKHLRNRRMLRLGAGAEPKPAESKPAEIVPEKVTPRKTENALGPKAANTKAGSKRPFPKED